MIDLTIGPREIYKVVVVYKDEEVKEPSSSLSMRHTALHKYNCLKETIKKLYQRYKIVRDYGCQRFSARYKYLITIRHGQSFCDHGGN
jgi:hypothetical protein